ncbi:MAG: hypothetical protein ACRDS1_16610 [Pseudonocardiaceae bacterium]
MKLSKADTIALVESILTRAQQPVERRSLTPRSPGELVPAIPLPGFLSSRSSRAGC